MSGLFRILLFTIFAWLTSRLLLGVFRSVGQKGSTRASVPPREPPRSISERLVRDPVCGLALPESRALQHGEHFFCSGDCRDRYLARKP